MNYLKKINRPLKKENIIDVLRNFFSLNNLNNVINQASTHWGRCFYFYKKLNKKGVRLTCLPWEQKISTMWMIYAMRKQGN
jgi:hypothetical protein